MELVWFFWLLCAVFSAVLARSKGRSGAWFFVGLLFGPFGLLVGLMPEQRAQKDSGRTSGGATDDEVPPHIVALRRNREAARQAQADASIRDQ